jgi:hypothetical protein
MGAASQAEVQNLIRAGLEVGALHMMGMMMMMMMMMMMIMMMMVMTEGSYRKACRLGESLSYQKSRSSSQFGIK